MKGRHERTKLQQTEVSELATVYAVRSLEEEKQKNIQGDPERKTGHLGLP